MVQRATLNHMLHNTKPALRQCVLADPAQFMGIDAGRVATVASRSSFVRLLSDPDLVCAPTLANCRRLGSLLWLMADSALSRSVTCEVGANG
jgi:hypothetical protein